jgi:hypothetical protein
MENSKSIKVKQILSLTHNPKIVRIEHLDGCNTRITISWSGNVPFVPSVNTLLDSLDFVNQKEDSQLIN